MNIFFYSIIEILITVAIKSQEFIIIQKLSLTRGASRVGYVSFPKVIEHKTLKEWTH